MSQEIFDFLIRQRLTVSNDTNEWEITLSFLEFAEYDANETLHHVTSFSFNNGLMTVTEDDQVTENVDMFTPIHLEYGPYISVHAVFESPYLFEYVGEFKGLLDMDHYTPFGHKYVYLLYEIKPPIRIVSLPVTPESRCFEKLMSNQSLANTLGRQKHIHLVRFYENTDDIYLVTELTLTLPGYSAEKVSSVYYRYTSPTLPTVHVFRQPLQQYIRSQTIDFDICHWELSSEKYNIPTSTQLGQCHLGPAAFVNYNSIMVAKQRALVYADMTIVISEPETVKIWRTLMSKNDLADALEWNEGLVGESLPRFSLTHDTGIARIAVDTILVHISFAQEDIIVPFNESMRQNSFSLLSLEERNRTTKLGEYSISQVAKANMVSETKYDITGNCIDVIMQDEESMQHYLTSDPYNMIFVFPTNGQPFYACYHRSYLNQSEIFYKCGQEDVINLSTSVHTDDPIYKLNIREFPIFIRDLNFRILMNSNSQMFSIEPTTERVPYTISKQSIDNENYISADHCQIGTDKLISIVKELV